jgi:aspartate/methionine/tyrosine aminotransferase
LQKAVAFGLRKDVTYFKSLGVDMEAKRDRLSKGLTSIGFEVMDSQGTYFLVADYRSLSSDCDDVKFCEELTVDAGVTALPFSAFYQAGPDSGVNHFLRFCYCKQDELIDTALERLSNYFNGISRK